RPPGSPLFPYTTLFRSRRGTGRRFRPESEWIPLEVPAIVSPELFEQAQAQLARNRAVLTGRPPVRFYLLRGLLRCGRCGRKYLRSEEHTSELQSRFDLV